MAMTAGELLWRICLSGSAGGLVLAIWRLVEEGKTEKGFEAARGVPVWLFLLARGLVGVGGAIAVLLALVFAKRFPDNPTTTEQLLLISVSFVAGFVGHRLLPMVAARLERQIEQAVEKGTEEVRREVDQAVQYSRASRAIAGALADLQRSQLLPLAIESDIKELEAVRTDSPLDRKLHMVLARLYFEKVGDFDTAIGVLTDFIRNKEKQGQAGDKDTADALFNRACYFSRKSARLTGDESRKFKELALQDLGHSIQLSPENAVDASKDPDFDPLRQDPDFAGRFAGLL